jgi:hypothetical protein
MAIITRLGNLVSLAMPESGKLFVKDNTAVFMQKINS